MSAKAARTRPGMEEGVKDGVGELEGVGDLVPVDDLVGEPDGVNVVVTVRETDAVGDVEGEYVGVVVTVGEKVELVDGVPPKESDDVGVPDLVGLSEGVAELVGVPDSVIVGVGLTLTVVEEVSVGESVEVTLVVGEDVLVGDTVIVGDVEGVGVAVAEAMATLTAHFSWQSVPAPASLRHAAHMQHTGMEASGLQFTVNWVSPDAEIGMPVKDPPLLGSGLTDVKKPSLGPTPLGADKVQAGVPSIKEEDCPFPYA